MTDIESRVSSCFANVFPELTPEQIRTASPDTLARWDSVVQITLLAAIAEEFQFELDESMFETLTSYPLILQYVESLDRRN